MKKLRKIISLTAMTSALFLLITSAILYIVPPGRVAYWADWHLWGLTKTQWTNLHINLGVLFLVAIGLHSYLNWSPIVSYLKTRAKTLRVFTLHFNLALGLSLLVMVGTTLEMPPFSTIIQIGEGFKDRGAEKYGEPPYGHAELSTLKTFSQKMELDLNDSIKRLEQAGYTVENENMTLEELAEKYETSPQVIYLAMKPEKQTKISGTLPENPPPGIGRRTLADVCQEFDFNIPAVLRRLEEAGTPASADMPLKEIAEKHGMGPIDFYNLLKTIADDL
jgi:hypothetical protein